MLWRLLIFLAIVASTQASACQARFCQPQKSLAESAKSASFVAIGTVFDGRLEIEKIWKGQIGDSWNTSVAFDAYRCCDLYSKALEGSRWLIVSQSNPPKAVMAEHSRLLPEIGRIDAQIEKEMNSLLGAPQISPLFRSENSPVKVR